MTVLSQEREGEFSIWHERRRMFQTRPAHITKEGKTECPTESEGIGFATSQVFHQFLREADWVSYWKYTREYE